MGVRNLAKRMLRLWNRRQTSTRAQPGSTSPGFCDAIPSDFPDSVQAEERFAGMGMPAGATLHGTFRLGIAFQWRLPAVGACECLNDSAFQPNVSVLWTTTRWVRRCLEVCHFLRARTVCSPVNSDASLRTLSNATKLAALKSQRWPKSSRRSGCGELNGQQSSQNRLLEVGRSPSARRLPVVQRRSGPGWVRSSWTRR